MTEPTVPASPGPLTAMNVTENVMDVLSRYGVDIDNDLDNVLDAVARDITAVVERYDAALLADRQRQADQLARVYEDHDQAVKDRDDARAALRPLGEQRDQARAELEAARRAPAEIARRAALYRDFNLEAERDDRAEAWDSARKLAEEYVSAPPVPTPGETEEPPADPYVGCRYCSTSICCICAGEQTSCPIQPNHPERAGAEPAPSATGDTQDDACICGHSLERDHNAAGGCTRTLYDGEWCPCVGDDEDAPSVMPDATPGGTGPDEGAAPACAEPMGVGNESPCLQPHGHAGLCDQHTGPDEGAEVRHA